MDEKKYGIVADWIIRNGQHIKSSLPPDQLIVLTDDIDAAIADAVAREREEIFRIAGQYGDWIEAALRARRTP